MLVSWIFETFCQLKLHITSHIFYSITKILFEHNLCCFSKHWSQRFQSLPIFEERFQASWLNRVHSYYDLIGNLSNKTKSCNKFLRSIKWRNNYVQTLMNIRTSFKNTLLARKRYIVYLYLYTKKILVSDSNKAFFKVVDI